MREFKFLFDPDVKGLRDWHNWLDANRGDRAQLRRAQSPDDVLLTTAFAHFLQHMPRRWSEDLAITDAALVAAVLARVRQDDSKTSFAKALASPKVGGTKARMSELRFQQLQKSHTPEDFFKRLCRAVALLGGEVNIPALANDILHWLKENRTAPAIKAQDRLAVRWASDYYANFKTSN